MAGDLAGQTVVVIGGSAGIGLETGRRARAEGADVILTGRSPDRLKRAAAGLGVHQHRAHRRDLRHRRRAAVRLLAVAGISGLFFGAGPAASKVAVALEGAAGSAGRTESTSEWPRFWQWPLPRPEQRTAGGVGRRHVRSASRAPRSRP